MTDEQQVQNNEPVAAKETASAAGAQEETHGGDMSEGAEPQAFAKEKSPEELIAEYLDGWKRSRADYENLLKEVGRERTLMHAAASARVLETFLPLYEHFSRACAEVPAASDEKAKTWIEGVCYIKSQFAEIMKQFGVEEIMPAAGGVFDPAMHEAVGEEMVEETAPGAIVRVVSVGFRTNGKVLKPAQVIITK